jgi:predicted HD phosphohydrolase
MNGLFEPLQALARSSRIVSGAAEGGGLLEHSLKCAQAARNGGANDVMVVAALFHDVWHAFGNAADEFSEMPSADEIHAAFGARYLERFFPPEVCRLVADHVEAKRYRAARHQMPSSLGSTRSLLAQGGPMSPEECTEFESRPHFAAVLQLREWDDRSDTDILDYAPLDAYHDIIERLRIDRRPADRDCPSTSASADLP